MLSSPAEVGAWRSSEARALSPHLKFVSGQVCVRVCVWVCVRVCVCRAECLFVALDGRGPAPGKKEALSHQEQKQSKAASPGKVSSQIPWLQPNVRFMQTSGRKGGAALCPDLVEQQPLRWLSSAQILELLAQGFRQSGSCHHRPPPRHPSWVCPEGMGQGTVERSGGSGVRQTDQDSEFSLCFLASAQNEDPKVGQVVAFPAPFPQGIARPIR